MTKKKGIDIIGVPSTFGQRKLGVDLGPTAIRYAGLIPRLKQLDLDVNDKGDIKVSAVDIEKFQSEQNGLRNYDEIIDVTQKLNKEVSASIENKGERQFIKDHNIKTFTMSDIDKLGIKEVIENTIEYLKSRNVDGVHLSLDVDALDPLETPGTGTRVLGGLTYRESHFALELLHQSQSVTSMDLVEVNPLIDHNNHTAEQSVSLVGTFFGETLL